MTDEQAKQLRAPFGHLGNRRLRNAPVLDRLMFRTALADSGCWLWKGSCNPKGYGHIRRDSGGKLIAVHRASYEAFVAPIPSGKEIDHLCGIRNCVNPKHLEVVDRRTNVLRGRRNQNHGKTHCVHGHLLDEQNTYITTSGKRLCRTCARLRMRGYRAVAA